MAKDLIGYTVSQRIATITLNRPEKRNALNPDMVRGLGRALATAAQNEGVRVVVLKAEGKAFSAGADLAYLESLQQFSVEENREDSRQLMELFTQLYCHEKLTIAQVEGPALAGGCGLATLCDLCYATTEATFGYTEVRIGFIPALVSVFLSRKIGEGRARELLLTGDIWTAAQAQAAGLITGVETAARIEQAVNARATALRDGVSGQAVATMKTLLAETGGVDLSRALELAADYNLRARGSTDCQKGIRAFLDRRKIQW